MFKEFTGKNGKTVRIDIDAVLAVEELDSGCRILVGASQIEVKDSLETVMEAISSGDEEEDEDDED